MSQFLTKYLNHKYALLGVLVFVGLLFSKVLFFDFANYDDNIYLTSNKYVQNLNLSNVLYILSHQFYGHYFPITLLVHTIENFFFGLNPFIYHATSLVLHICNTALVYFLFKTHSKEKILPVLLALVFGIHPLQIETVAWIGARNNVLSSFFVLSGLVFYNEFLKEKKYIDLIWCFFLFLIACLAKSSAVIFPLLMFVFDWYSKRKFKLGVLLEKIPFFTISLIIGLIAVRAAHHFGSVEPLSLNYSWYNRPFLLSYQIGLFLANFLFPVDLLVRYDNPIEESGLLPIWSYLSFILIPLLGWLIYRAKQQRKVIFGLLGAFVVISLVLKINFSTNVIAADRYLYLAVPFLGIVLVSVSNKLNRLVLTIGLSWLLLLAVKTWTHLEIWRNGKTLFAELVESSPGKSKPFLFRGINFIKTKEYEFAKHDFKIAIKLDEKEGKNWAGLATAQMLLGETDSAEIGFIKALSLDSTIAGPYFHLGNIYGRKEDYAKANFYFSRHVALEPNNAETYFNLANLDIIKEDYLKAIKNLSKTIQLDPNHHLAMLNRGYCYFKTDQMPLACSDWIGANNLGNTNAASFLKQHCY